MISNIPSKLMDMYERNLSKCKEYENKYTMYDFDARVEKELLHQIGMLQGIAYALEVNGYDVYDLRGYDYYTKMSRTLIFH